MTNGAGSPGRRRAKAFGSIVAVLALTVLVATWPVTTKQGVNFEVSAYRIPLYLKALEFVDRSVQYQQIAGAILRDAKSDDERALQMFRWTRRNIRDAPPGWPIVDDHIMNIITRGYGVNDQQADVFATLLTYGGVPAFWQKLKWPEAQTGPLLTFARVDGRWVVFDVANDVIFRTAAGRLATLDDLKGHPELVPERVSLLGDGSRSYADSVTRLPMPPVPHPLRAELQMPSARVWYELKAAVGVEHP